MIKWILSDTSAELNLPLSLTAIVLFIQLWSPAEITPPTPARKPFDHLVALRKVRRQGFLPTKHPLEEGYETDI